MSDQSSKHRAEDLAAAFSATLTARPQVDANWGLAASTWPRLSHRVLLSLLLCIAVLLVFPLVMMLLRPSSAAPPDEAYQTLDAYVHVRVKGVELETGLSPAARTLLAGASRVETADGPLIVLRTDSTCWAVPAAPSLPVPAPKQVPPAYCN
jgi:hypothetical protein